MMAKNMRKDREGGAVLFDSKRSNMNSLKQEKKRLSRVETVAHSILENIRNGNYVPGQRLVEADLTAEMGISRGPLREALRLLAAGGIIELIPNRGAIIRKIYPADIKERLALIDVLGTLVLKNNVMNDMIKTDLSQLINGEVADHPSLLIRISDFYIYLAKNNNNQILEDMIQRLNIACFARYMVPVKQTDHTALWQQFKAIGAALTNGRKDEALKTHSKWMKLLMSQ